MPTAYDVKPGELIKKATDELKKTAIIKKPPWANFVKTSPARERIPVDKDWWYVRAASILRKLYTTDKAIGTNKLRNFYGGKKNRGHKPERFYPGSGKIIRTILQQLEKAELIKQITEGVHKGRKISSKGKKFLDTLIKNAK